MIFEKTALHWLMAKDTYKIIEADFRNILKQRKLKYIFGLFQRENNILQRTTGV